MDLMTMMLFLAVGLLVGALHHLTLWWNVRLLTAQGPALKAIAVQIARLALIAGVLIVAVRFGAMPLLMTALGILISRFAAIRLVGAQHG
jgi:F1F0 ATPase subunit 2